MKVTPKIVSARVVKMVKWPRRSSVPSGVMLSKRISAPSLRPTQLRWVSLMESLQFTRSSPSSIRCA